MTKYIPSINKNNPLWTRCVECGKGWTKRVVKKRCPICKVRGSLLFFHQYDLAHCPMCAHVISTYNREQKKYIVLLPKADRSGICPLCGSDAAIAHQSIRQTKTNAFVLDVELYQAIYNKESAMIRIKGDY